MLEQQVGHSRISIWATQRYRTQTRYKQLPSIAEKLGQEHRFITMDACTAEPEIGEKEVAVWAAAETEEAFAATRALVHVVRHSVGTTRLGGS